MFPLRFGSRLTANFKLRTFKLKPLSQNCLWPNEQHWNFPQNFQQQTLKCKNNQIQKTAFEVTISAKNSLDLIVHSMRSKPVRCSAGTDELSPPKRRSERRRRNQDSSIWYRTSDLHVGLHTTEAIADSLPHTPVYTLAFELRSINKSNIFADFCCYSAAPSTRRPCVPDRASGSPRASDPIVQYTMPSTIRTRTISLQVAFFRPKNSNFELCQTKKKLSLWSLKVGNLLFKFFPSHSPSLQIIFTKSLSSQIFFQFYF